MAIAHPLSAPIPSHVLRVNTGCDVLNETSTSLKHHDEPPRHRPSPTHTERSENVEKSLTEMFMSEKCRKWSCQRTQP